MSNAPAPDDLQARVGIAKGAPWAILGAKAMCVAVVIYTAFTGNIYWPAGVLALALLPLAIIAFLTAGLVNRLLFENERLTRELRTTTRH